MQGADALRPGQRIFAATVFPVTLALTLAATLWLMEAGVPPAIAFGPPVLLTYLFVSICERLIPYERGWLHSSGDLRVDTGHLFASGFVTLELLRPLALGVAVASAGWLSSRFGAGLWPGAWPILAQLALALVLGEFTMYWAHRLTHEIPLLWRFHATHHSAPRLYWLNSARFHPLDLALSYFCWYVPLIALGAGEPLIALYALVSAVHGIFQHANLQLRLGPLNWVFSMAELHRWHHSRSVEESNRNYGQNLIVWDVIFGTRHLPSDREPPRDIGLADLAAFPMTWWAQVTAPLHWARIERESASLRGGAARVDGL